MGWLFLIRFAFILEFCIIDIQFNYQEAGRALAQ